MKKNLTFLLITYNQEKYIIYTLDSIKYQIVNYLHEYEIQLIIADDASCDQTENLITDWIDKNKNLFFDITYNRNQTNQGINKNLRLSFKDIKGEYTKLISGDDMLPQNSIEIFLEELNDNDMVMGIPLYFMDSSIGSEWKKTLSHIANEYLDGKRTYLNRMNESCFVHGCSLFLNSKLLRNSNVEKFMSNFEFLEDYPMWYAMGKEFDDIKFKFVVEIAILYRRTENSVCFIRNNVIRKDRKKMAKYILKSKKVNLYSKLVKINEYIVFSIGNRYLQIYGLLDNYIQHIRRKRVMNYIEEKYGRFIKIRAQENDRYLKMLINEKE